MEEVMNRQIRNAITSMVVTAFAGLGLMAFGQNPGSPQQTCPVQTVQPVQQPVVIQQPVEQNCPVQQPVGQNCTVKQVVEEFVEQQPTACVQQPVQQTTACATGCCTDLCVLVKDIESNA